MGSSASKATRTLPRVAATSKQVTHRPPPVASTRPSNQSEAQPSKAKDGYDPQLSRADDGYDPKDGMDPQEPALNERLKQLGPVHLKNLGPQTRPASEDGFTTTLEARQRLDMKTEAYFEQQQANAGQAKRLVTSGEAMSIVKSLQDGADRSTVESMYGIHSDVIDKLAGLSIPKIIGPIQGRRRPRNTHPNQA